MYVKPTLSFPHSRPFASIRGRRAGKDPTAPTADVIDSLSHFRILPSVPPQIRTSAGRTMISRLLPQSPGTPAIGLFWRVWVAGWCWAAAVSTQAATYYVHPTNGDDRASGTRVESPWQSLAKVNATQLKAGDQVLLAAGERFAGQLALNGLSGTAAEPIVFGSYPANPAKPELRPTIDGRGYVAAVHLKNSRHVRVRDLALTADGGGMRKGQPVNAKMRCGVLIEADAAGDYENVELSRLHVFEVSFEEPGFVRPAADVKTANGTVSYGWGIRFIVNSPQARMHGITVSDCLIENVNHTGLKFTGPAESIQKVKVERVKVLNVGGPGVQMSGLRGGHFTHLDVNGSGSPRDSRNWARGSGLWTWTSSDVVIEKSRFLNANGPGDSAGVHIDFNCRNVIVQYNLSANNAGGFCEILGNNHNCAYRYNVSVNDGHRIKGKNGAFQEGKTFWLSGYVGKAKPTGPTNSYFYNNTLFVSANIVAKVAVGPTAEGVLIANNIFHIVGQSQMVQGDQFRPDIGKTEALKRVVFTHNLYLRADNWPAALGMHDQSPFIGDPDFLKAGGLELADYTPKDAAQVKNRGIRIAPLPGDDVGLVPGLAVSHDILGNPVVDQPDLGAIELP